MIAWLPLLIWPNARISMKFMSRHFRWAADETHTASSITARAVSDAQAWQDSTRIHSTVPQRMTRSPSLPGPSRSREHGSRLPYGDLFHCFRLRARSEFRR